MATLAELWREAEASDVWADLVLVVDRQRLFSPNEELDEVPTSALRYALAPYRHAQALLKDQRADCRRRAIEQADSQLNRFLELCRIWGVYVPAAAETPDAKRREKIADFKRRKEISERIRMIEEIQKRRRLDADSGDDLEEMQRECWLLQIEAAARDAQNMLVMNERELEMLKLMETMPNKGMNRDVSPTPRRPTYRINKDLSVEKVTLGQTNLDRRQQLAAEVFRDRNLPTMTLDEFAEGQLAAAKERQQRQQAQEAAQKQRDSDESESDSELYRQREWDNWKDDHEKGIGNKGYM